MLVFVTGATSGIGKSAAMIFAKSGYDLVITGRRKERLADLKSNLEKIHKVKVTTLCFDIRSFKETEEAISSLKEADKKIDILINNAGLAAGLASLQDGSVSDWERMIDTNVKGLLYTTKIISKLMIENGKGHIVNIGSVAGKEVYANGNVYCATKHAVDALSRAMRIDLLPFGIKVTAINPGMVETEFSLVRFEGDAERAKKVYNGLQPLTPDDIAETIFWAATRPSHVNINDILIMPAAQASSTVVARKTSS